ncbi:hypothetical protein AB0M86_31615 [Streptomyces sp. NPDC051639]|uniref:hypothetical protein n=1 Tax=unclassified Streptomyces TaxID=2593676 RepID=UPI002E36978A|nr:hypothetical protein [Streptomyces sp. NBC_01455]
MPGTACQPAGEQHGSADHAFDITDLESGIVFVNPVHVIMARRVENMNTGLAATWASLSLAAAFQRFQGSRRQ